MVGSKAKYKTKNGPVERLYYTCSAFHNKGLTACHSNGIRVDLIDPIAIKKIANKLNSSNLVDVLQKYVIENSLDENTTDGKKRKLEIEIKNQSKRKSELRTLYTDGIITSEELKEDIQKISQKTKEYEILIEELNHETSINQEREIKISKIDIKDFLKSISETLDSEDKDERILVKEMLRLMIDRIEILSKTMLDMEVSINYSEMLFKLLQYTSE
jgi:site-specific DNA recombinase